MSPDTADRGAPRGAEEAPASQQSVSLPKIRQAASWGRATDDLLAALEKEEAEAVAAFEVARERARAARRAANAIRQIRGLVAMSEASPVAARSPGHSHPLPPGRWSRHHERCVNCATSALKSSLAQAAGLFCF